MIVSWLCMTDNIAMEMLLLGVTISNTKVWDPYESSGQNTTGCQNKWNCIQIDLSPDTHHSTVIAILEWSHLIDH